MFGIAQTKVPSCCIELRLDDCSTSPKGPHYVRKRKRGVYEMPNPTIAAGTVIAVHEERRQKIMVVLRNWNRPNWQTTPVARPWRTSSRNSDTSLRRSFRRRSSEPLQVDCQCRRRDILRVAPEFPSGTSTI